MCGLSHSLCCFLHKRQCLALIEIKIMYSLNNKPGSQPKPHGGWKRKLGDEAPPHIRLSKMVFVVGLRIVYNDSLW